MAIYLAQDNLWHRAAWIRIMKKIIIPLLVIILISDQLLGFSKALLRPTDTLYLSVINKEYIWGPVRKLRLFLSITFGASPNDVVEGDLIVERALDVRDYYFIKHYSYLLNIPNLLRTLTSACVINDDKLIASMAQQFELTTGSPAPACEGKE